MKITFINPPNPFLKEPAMNPPLGLAYLSSYVKQHTGWQVSFLDYNLLNYAYYNTRQYLREIQLNSDIYAITGATPQYFWMKEIAIFVKKNTSAKVILGGPHASNLHDECLNECEVDYVIVGEGEERLTSIITGTEKYNTPIEPLKRAYIKDLDNLPFPDRDINDLQQYKRTIKGKQAVHLVTLRGCPYNCAFCDRNSVGRNVRYRSVDNVISEIDLLLSRYGIDSFVIYDDIFTLDQKRLYKFCEAFKERKVNWRCWARTDLVDREMLETMKESGLTSITFGVESGDDKILSNINKGTTRAINQKALSIVKKLDIPVRCSLMFGNPGETKESIDNTINLIKETQPDEWNLAVLTPIPGSDIWNNPEKYGVSFDKKWLKKRSYLPCNRFGESGVGNYWVEIDTMPKVDFKKNLEYFISELEKVCPRKNIQDTIQEIKISE